MHGPPWLENPILPIMLIAVGFVLLFISIRMKKKQPESEQAYNFELKLFGHKILDTSNRWMVFSAFVGLMAIATSWVAFIVWEVYEWLSVMFNPNTTIQTTPWDLAIDLWIDSLGALAMCFIYDEFNEDN